MTHQTLLLTLGLFAVWGCQAPRRDTASPSAPASAASAAPLPSAAGAPAASVKASEAYYGPEMDWITQLGSNGVALLGESVDRGEPAAALSKACRALYESRAKGSKGFLSFSCAVAPSGEAWASVAVIEPVANDAAIRWVDGHWQVLVAKGGHVKALPRQAFRCAAHGTCQDPNDCYQNTHCEGLHPPSGFWFVDVDGKAPHEAFLFSYEEPNSSGVDERSIQLYSASGPAPALLPVSQRASIVGLEDCNGDARPELVINPYRVAADEFSLNFGGYNRTSAPEWTLLVEQQPDGEYAGATELSRAYASRLCPEKVTTPFDADALRWPSRLHCAKLWGAPEARLVRPRHGRPRLGARARARPTRGRAAAALRGSDVLRRGARMGHRFQRARRGAGEPARIQMMHRREPSCSQGRHALTVCRSSAAPRSPPAAARSDPRRAGPPSTRN